MATQDEAREAIIDAIASYAPRASTAESIKALAEAYSLVKKSQRSSGRAL